MYHVYILRTSNNSLYIGQTCNLTNRIKDHGGKKGAKYVKDEGKAFDVAYSEDYPTQLEAMRREKQLKGWTRAKKEALISGDLERLKQL